MFFSVFWDFFRKKLLEFKILAVGKSWFSMIQPIYDSARKNRFFPELFLNSGFLGFLEGSEVLALVQALASLTSSGERCLDSLCLFY